MLNEDKTRIQFPNIILCEGRDECSFMINYLSYLIKEDEIFDTIQVIDFGGITDLKRQFKQLIKMPEFSTLQSILIIRDAEHNPEGAKESIHNVLKSNGYEAPVRPGTIAISNGIRIAYMLLPSCDENGDESGTLEDLCLKIISEPDHEGVLGEIDNYLSVMKNGFSKEYPRIHKNKLHLLISSYDKYVDAKAGEAGQRGLYDWQSPYLKKMHNLMYDLCISGQ